MITTAFAMNILSAQRKFLSFLGSLRPFKLKDSCHALEILFKLNKDHFIITADSPECLNFAHCIRKKLATRSLTRKHEVVDKFSKWTVLLNV